MVTAAQRSVFAQKNAGDILSNCDDFAISLAERFFKAAELMNEARGEVLAFRHFPAQHWKKVWSTNLLERVNAGQIYAILSIRNRFIATRTGHPGASQPAALTMQDQARAFRGHAWPH